MKRWLTEPLLHFLLLGGLLFGGYVWLDRGDSDTPRVVRISAAEVEWLKQTWSRQWQRLPDETELRGLVTDYLKETLLAREAQQLGLDDNDTVVRRRLAQKMKFLVENTARLAEPEETVLRQYYDDHHARYQKAASISFSQLYFKTEPSAHVALQVLAQNPSDELGEPTLLPPELEQADGQTVTNYFGQQFAAQVFSLETNQWQGPVMSAYGFHLIKINARQAAQLRAFDEVRSKVLEDWYRTEQDRANEQFFAALLKKYDVVIEESVKPLIGPLAEVRQ
jgi:parvulin-like peptidyl-prolyl isomerase